MGDKTEKPTRKKLEDARKKGQVAQSPNVPRFMACAALMELAFGTRDLWLSRLQEWILHTVMYMELAGGKHDHGSLAVLVAAPIATWAALFCIGALAVGVVVALIGNIMQTGFMMAPEALRADPQRISPLSHAKQMISVEKILEMLMNIFKVLLVGGCVIYAILGSFEQLVSLARAPIDLAADVFIGILQRAERMALLTLLLFAAADWAMKKKFFMKQMMMDKEEIERERKDQNGDKHVRQFRRKISRELLANNAAAKTRKANAIVTNPTHFAVALRYHPDEAPLPVVMARGADQMAKEMIRIGREAGIPIIRSVWLARTLYSVGREGKMIPSVAVKATAYVYSAIITVLEAGGSFDGVMEVKADQNGGLPQ